MKNKYTQFIVVGVSIGIIYDCMNTDNVPLYIVMNVVCYFSVSLIGFAIRKFSKSEEKDKEPTGEDIYEEVNH